MNYFLAQQSQWKDILGGISACIPLVILVVAIIFAIRSAIRCVKDCRENPVRKKIRNSIRIRYDKQVITEEAKRYLDGKENVFLPNDLTLEVADVFCHRVLTSICCPYISDVNFCNKKYLHYKSYLFAKSDCLDSIKLSERNLQPLTSVDEQYQFLIAAAAYVKAILTCPSAQKIVYLENINPEEIKITIGEPYRASHQSQIDIEYTAPCVFYKAPPAPEQKKWY